MTVICLFLPLSAIWAGVIANDPGVGDNGPDAHQALLKGQSGRATPENSLPNTCMDRFRGSVGTSTLGKDPESPTAYKNGSVDGGIRINHEWSIDNDKAEASRNYSAV